jgi:DNA primase large subunit
MGEVENQIKENVSRTAKLQVPPPIQEKLDQIGKVFEENRSRLGAEDLPAEMIREAFPPCIRYCMEGLLSGRRASHMERFALTSFLVNVGMPIESMVDLYVSVTDFDEQMTRYQIEHIAGIRGNKTRYTPPLCDTLRTHGICRSKDDVCNRVKHPLSYYRIKAKRILAQKPPTAPPAKEEPKPSEPAPESPK